MEAIKILIFKRISVQNDEEHAQQVKNDVLLKVDIQVQGVISSGMKNNQIVLLIYVVTDVGGLGDVRVG